MKKLKILQFPIRNNSGGVTQYVLSNWRHIDKNRFQFDFATLDKKFDYENELLSQGCKVYYITCYAENDLRQFTFEFNSI